MLPLALQGQVLKEVFPFEMFLWLYNTKSWETLPMRYRLCGQHGTVLGNMLPVSCGLSGPAVHSELQIVS